MLQTLCLLLGVPAGDPAPINSEDFPDGLPVSLGLLIGEMETVASFDSFCRVELKNKRMENNQESPGH